MDALTKRSSTFRNVRELVENATKNVGKRGQTSPD